MDYSPLLYPPLLDVRKYDNAAMKSFFATLKTDCFRLEQQSPGVSSSHWINAPFHGARDFRFEVKVNRARAESLEIVEDCGVVAPACIALIMLDQLPDVLLLLEHGIPSSGLEQMKDKDNRQTSPLGGIKLPWSAVILIMVLTGAVWIFFYIENMQLDPGSTGAVALVVIILVMLGRWLLMRGQRKRAPK